MRRRQKSPSDQTSELPRACDDLLRFAIAVNTSFADQRIGETGYSRQPDNTFRRTDALPESARG